jgi:CRISPR-associated exonuclease Cas4
METKIAGRRAMIDRSEVGMLPISALNALEYCPRKFYYQFVQGEMLVNDLVLEGTLAHERVHQAGTHKTGAEEIETTRLYLYSEALHLSGFADVIQERAGVIVPVEYKHGHLGEWLNDHVQLCAQALCLEERLADRPETGRKQGPLQIPYGYIYYVGSRRRAKVQFTQQLRARTLETIAQALKVAMLKTPPSPLSGKMAARCPDCSLLPLCMPDEVQMLQSRKGNKSGN